MTYREWLQQCADLKDYYEDSREEEECAEAAEPGPEGNAWIQYVPPEATEAYKAVREDVSALLAQVEQNACEWQPDLAALAAKLTPEFLRQHFVEFMQLPVLRFLARENPLPPTVLAYAFELESAEAIEERPTKAILFLAQLPFNEWDLADEDISRVWGDFVATWAGEGVGSSLLDEMSLDKTDVAQWYREQGKLLHAAAIYEFCWRNLDDMWVEDDPGIRMHYLTELHYLYSRAERQRDAVRCFGILDEMALQEGTEFKVYEETGLYRPDFNYLIQQLTKAVDHERQDAAEERLKSSLGKVWHMLQEATQEFLIRAETDYAKDLSANCGEIALGYWKAIENEWTTAYRHWCRSRRIYCKREWKDVWAAIVGQIRPRKHRQISEFVHSRKRPEILKDRRTCDVLQRLKELRHRYAHPGEIRIDELEEVLAWVRRDAFLKKYLQALRPRNR